MDVIRLVFNTVIVIHAKVRTAKKLWNCCHTVVHFWMLSFKGWRKLTLISPSNPEDLEFRRILCNSG